MPIDMIALTPPSLRGISGIEKWGKVQHLPEVSGCLSPADAERLLTLNSFERQRPESKHATKYFREEMDGDNWEPFFQLSLCAYTNKYGDLAWVVINGQHRLIAQVASGTKQAWSIARDVLPTAMDVARRYAKIDTNRTRNIYDLIRAIALDNELTLGKEVTGKLVSAGAFLRSGFTNPNRWKIHSDERIDIAKTYSVAAAAYLETFSGVQKAISKAMVRASTFSVALATFDEAGSTFGDNFVAEFWSGLARDDGLRIGDPRKVAVNHLRDAVMPGKTGRVMVSAAFSARYLANCWNAYAENRQLTKTRVENATAPIRIVGTHWDGSVR